MIDGLISMRSVEGKNPGTEYMFSSYRWQRTEGRSTDSSIVSTKADEALILMDAVPQ